MGTKVFDEKGRFKIICDERDIDVATWHRYEVWCWCTDRNIELEYQGTANGIDIWRIKNEKHRMWFILRWT
jgi:hypothetical protein